MASLDHRRKACGGSAPPQLEQPQMFRKGAVMAALQGADRSGQREQALKPPPG